ncbi:MAG: sigma-70 family RNA polymerase sigma factor [Actinomycetota bacterium]
MTPARHTGNAHDLVADTLREKQSDFEAFVRARVAPQDVDDLLQVAALRAIERADTIDDPERVAAWLYRLHRNLIIDTYRAQASERKYVDSDGEVPEPVSVGVEDPCTCSVIQAKRLPESYAAILSLVDTGGLQLSDAADRLEISRNNAAVRLHRARKALRAAMLEHCGVADPRDCANCRCVDDICCAA